MEFRVHLRPKLRPPPPLCPPLLKRLEEPRLLAEPPREPLLAPLKALPDEEPRLAEGLALDCEALGRLAPAEAAEREDEGVPVDGRAAAPPDERPAPPESQPRACLLAADVDGVPLLLSRLWSGCHFCLVPDEEARAPELLTLALRLTLLLTLLLTLTFRLTFTFTSL